MTGVIFIIMAFISLALFQFDYSICAGSQCNLIDIGFANRSWFLWGAIFYSIAGILTALIKRCWVITIMLSNAVVFHMYLIYSTYQNTGIICPVCISFLIAEIVLTSFYLLIDRQYKFNNFIALGFGKAALIISVTVFFLSPSVIPQTSANEKTDQTDAIAYYEESGMRTVVEDTYQIENSYRTLELPESSNKDTNYILPVENSHGVQTQIDLSQKPALMCKW